MQCILPGIDTNGDECGARFRHGMVLLLLAHKSMLARRAGARPVHPILRHWASAVISLRITIIRAFSRTKWPSLLVLSVELADLAPPPEFSRASCEAQAHSLASYQQRKFQTLFLVHTGG
jgi:hypothetical protein